jgi:hypothetical protein
VLFSIKLFVLLSLKKERKMLINLRKLRKEGIIPFNGLPLFFGITTKEFGDCSYNLNEKEMKEKNEILEKNFCADWFLKLKVNHGSDISIIDQYNGYRNNPIVESDALIIKKNQKNIPLVICNTADCPIVIITNTNAEFISLVHSGWKGTAQNIVGKTIDKIIDNFENNSKNILAFIWGGICGNCYDFQEDPGSNFSYNKLEKKLDLKKTIKNQLLNKINSRNIFLSNHDSCSFHSKDEESNDYLFYSYRRDKSFERNCVFATFSLH